MKAITFLGTGDYQQTRYAWDGEEVTTELFSHAVWELFHPEEPRTQFKSWQQGK